MTNHALITLPSADYLDDEVWMESPHPPSRYPVKSATPTGTATKATSRRSSPFPTKCHGESNCELAPRWHDLVSVRRSTNHLFLRYRRDERLETRES